MKELLDQLEAAVLRRNPSLARRLRPGLTEYRILKMLEEGKVHGAVAPIIALFSWKNGTLPHADPAEQRPNLFPGTDYMLAELNYMISDFNKFEEMSMYNPRCGELVGRYFPLLWNGATSFMALDLAPKGIGKIVIIEQRAEKLLRDAYPTFAAFLEDGIRANKNNAPLACFRFTPLTQASQPGKISRV